MNRFTVEDSGHSFRLWDNRNAQVLPDSEIISVHPSGRASVRRSVERLADELNAEEWGHFPPALAAHVANWRRPR